MSIILSISSEETYTIYFDFLRRRYIIQPGVALLLVQSCRLNHTFKNVAVQATSLNQQGIYSTPHNIQKKGYTKMDLDKLVFAKKMQPFKADALIFDENSTGEELYFIFSGSVRILKKLENSELKLAVLHAGGFFGEIAMITGENHVASAVANEDCMIHTMDKDAFVKNIVNDKEFALRFIETLASRLRETDLNLWDHAMKIFKLYETFKMSG
jgi:hypothetical protein